MNDKWHIFVLFLFVLSDAIFAADEFNFDVSSYQNKNFVIGGYFDYALNYQKLNQDASANTLYFRNQTTPDSLTQHTGIIELNGEYKSDQWHGRFNFHAETYENEITNGHLSEIYELIAAYQPLTGITLEAGKKAIKWGKGYAFNPVGFVERPKDPSDPELSREGYVVATADIIKSYNGDIKTLAFTPVYLPVTSSINKDFGAAEYDNFAAKIYLLYKDTDIDFTFLNQGSRSWRYGFDFSRNINTNFEVHGEWAYFNAITTQYVSDSGVVSSQTDSTTRWLLGLRYLTENETTIIAEYYRNNSGYSAEDMKSFVTAVDSASASNNTTLLSTLSSIGEKTFLARNPGRNYLYLRLSSKEPFDWVYFVPALTTIYNLDDNSYSLSPEIIYTGIQNFEFRLKATLLYGNNYSEFIEKRVEQKYEFKLRYFF